MRHKKPHDDFPCPHCGAPVPAHASFCRKCGASDESGWSERQHDAPTGGYAEEDDDFDYDDFLRREFPDQAPPATSAQQFRKLAFVILVLVLCFMRLWWAF